MSDDGRGFTVPSSEQFSKAMIVGTTAVCCFRSNPYRTNAEFLSVIGNTGKIYFDTKSSVSTSSECVISPNERMKLEKFESVSVYKGEIWVISDTASQTLKAQENIYRRRIPVY